MATGTVKWFNSEKGFGFIAPDDGSADVFAHFTAIVGTGRRDLFEGQQVEFETQRGQKGLQATNIRALCATGWREAARRLSPPIPDGYTVRSLALITTRRVSRACRTVHTPGCVLFGDVCSPLRAVTRFEAQWAVETATRVSSSPAMLPRRR